MASDRGAFPTPADLGFPARTGRRAARWAVPLALLAAMAVGYPYLADVARGPLLRLFPAEGLSLSQALVVVFGGPAVLFLMIAFHEAGHAMSGVLAGLEFEMMAAGPVLLRSVKVASGKRLKMDLHRQPSLMAGYSVCLPPPRMNRQSLRRGMLWHIAGGPGASLLVGAGSLALAALMPATTGWETVLRALLLLMGLGSLLVGLATALPTGGRSLLNDGARWLQLTRGGQKASRDLTLLTTSSRAMIGDEPDSWDGHGLRTAGQISDSSLFEFWTLRYLWLHLWDTGRLADAGTVLRRALGVAATQGPAVRDQAALDAARFCLWACSAPDVARAWLTRTGHEEEQLAEDAEIGVALFFDREASREGCPRSRSSP